MKVLLNTDGKGVVVNYAKIRRHPTLDVEMANLDLSIGDAEINIRFDSWAEMIAFCDQHNFEYFDDR